MRRLSAIAGVFVAATFAVAACGGSTPATSGPALPTLPAGAVPTVPTGAVPTIALPSLPVGVLPSFNGDPTLAAKFPTTIGGKPVTPATTALYSSLFASFGGAYEAQKFAAAMGSIGVDPNTVSYGAASVELSDTNTITAIRTPNYSAAQFLSALPGLTAIFSPDEPAPTVGQVSVGGKTVTTLTDSSETTTYYYASGDTIWTTDATDPADLTAIFTAIQ